MTDKTVLLSIAARLATRSHLQELFNLIESQKSVSTKRLEKIVDRLGDKLADEGYLIRRAAEKVDD